MSAVLIMLIVLAAIFIIWVFYPGSTKEEKLEEQKLGPDGQMVEMAPAEYEYDAEVRAEEEILKNQMTVLSNANNKTT